MTLGHSVTEVPALTTGRGPRNPCQDKGPTGPQMGAPETGERAAPPSWGCEGSPDGAQRGLKHSSRYRQGQHSAAARTGSTLSRPKWRKGHFCAARNFEPDPRGPVVLARASVAGHSQSRVYSSSATFHVIKLLSSPDHAAHACPLPVCAVGRRAGGASATRVSARLLLPEPTSQASRPHVTGLPSPPSQDDCCQGHLSPSHCSTQQPAFLSSSGLPSHQILAQETIL